jgi:hypothetical protein
VLVGEKHGEVIGVHMLGNPSAKSFTEPVSLLKGNDAERDARKLVFPPSYRE